jgi:transformation/transcription domain-associated protein
MMESLAQRPPSLSSILSSTTSASPRSTGTEADPTKATTRQPNTKVDAAISRLYYSRVRELVAAQAKTLSFLTYLLRTFSAELKPYEDVLATNVVALMTTCPRESLGTRKELLVATRHLLNSDFRAGFYRHIDPMLDERLLMGHGSSGGSSSSGHRPDPTLIRPLAYTTLSDFVQHVRTLLNMTQMSRVVCLFSRILHDASKTLPLTTQYTAVRTLLSVIDLIFHNNDPDAQLGRDMLVRILDTLVDKLQALADYFPEVMVMERKRETMEQHAALVMPTPPSADGMDESSGVQTSVPTNNSTAWLLLHHHQHYYNNNGNQPPDSVRDIQSMIRAIIVGQKTLIYYISSYRAQRAELLSPKPPPPAAGGEIVASPSASSHRETPAPPPPPQMPPLGSNEEVATAMLKITNTEIAIIDRYIVTALSAMKLLTEAAAERTAIDYDIGPGLATATATSTALSKRVPTPPSSAVTSSVEKTLAEQHRDALTYFAAAFTGLDGYNLRRSLGRRLDMLIDSIVDDPMVMIVPRHLLGSNSTTSYEFCSMLLDWLVARMDLLCARSQTDLIFLSEQPSGCHQDSNECQYIREQLHRVSQLPAQSSEKVRQRSTTMLQLFERVLKSLSAHPDNEAIVRRHLRRIVVVCLRSAMENTNGWPESYCMLVRYVFRSISAGKFEDSYRALLPLIPTVLNGLYRVVSSTLTDSMLRRTAIELCLTIPARLSSLLPHMNLLLRIIIPALDSKSGDLVNLGYVLWRFGP